MANSKKSLSVHGYARPPSANNRFPSYPLPVQQHLIGLLSHRKQRAELLFRQFQPGAAEQPKNTGDIVCLRDIRYLLCQFRRPA